MLQKQNDRTVTLGGCSRREMLFAALAGASTLRAAARGVGGFDSARDAAKAIRSKRISSLELTLECWRRIDLYNAQINGIVWPMKEASITQAKQADDAIARKQALGPFHGVPITVKESYHVGGTPTTWGIEQYRNFKAHSTATAVERLERSGAVVLGKTNVPLMLFDQQTYNDVYGTTSNPWNIQRTPGGSSGGSTAALASGIGFLSLGSDIGGSIRVPSHFCGVYGLKPTLDLVPVTGQFPPGVEFDFTPFNDLLVCGPMARTAHDLRAALSVLAGPDRFENTGYRWTPKPPRHLRLRDFRVGVVEDDALCPVSPEVRDVIRTAVDRIAKAGASIKEGWPSGLDRVRQYQSYLFLLGSAIGTTLPGAADLARLPKEHPAYPFAQGMRATHQEWLQQTQERLRFRALWQEYFSGIDVLVCPVAFTHAFEHDHSEPLLARQIAMPEGRRPYFDLLYWVHQATLVGLPAVSAPIGVSRSNLPVGLQIIAPFLEDATALEFAALLGDVVGGFTAPKGFE